MSRHFNDSLEPIDPGADAIGPDGKVRLRCYLPLADSIWFSVFCSGRQSCGHAGSIGVRAAIQIVGSAEATVGQLARRLRCNQCGNGQVGIMLQPDTRPPEMLESEGPLPETRAGLPDETECGWGGEERSEPQQHTGNASLRLPWLVACHGLQNRFSCNLPERCGWVPWVLQ